jgi:short-subunit dehydrogenase
MPTALITGATAGIGAAFVRRLAADGLDLVLLARDAERLERTAEECRTAHRVDAEVLVADLATDEGIAAGEERAAKGIDLLVNNAGFGLNARFPSAGAAREAALLRVHCEAVLRLTQAALPPMIERGRGGVINVASVAAFFTRGTYSAAKAWTVTFSESARRDIAGSGVNVMALCPGWVRTEFHQRSNMDMSGVPDFMWLDADKLVAAAVRDFRRGAAVSIPGPQYKALVGVSRLIPRAVTSRIATRVGRRY